MRRANLTNPNGKNQSSTKFTQYQKEKMLEFAERIEWKLEKKDEEVISDFCSKIGVKKRVLKEWMHNIEKTFSMKRATIDILPECLIHKIVSYLSFKEATKMSILSKTWLQAWFTHPNLEFTIGYLQDNMKIVDSIMDRYRDGKIPIEKFKLFSGDSHGVPLLIDKWLDIALQNGVKDLVFGVPSFTSLSKLLLTPHGLMLRVSLSSCVVNCRSLRKLSLFYVNIDEYMLQTLLNSCPLIVAFSLEYCSGLEKIELLNLQKIKSISIRTLGYECVKIKAPTLEHMLCSGCSLEEYNVESQNLKSLVLSKVRISNGFFQHFISRSQFLESLTLVQVYNRLERPNICRSQSLKVLKIKFSRGIEEIDAPNLVSLDYEGAVPEFKIAKELSQLKHSKIHLYNFNELNAAWFCRLRKFLANATSWSHVFLGLYKCNEIEMKGLQLHHGVAIPQVDILDVDIRSSRKCPTVVDALLWSCRPRRLNLQSTSEMITCFIDCLMYMKNPSRQSTSYGNKLWHCQLKEVKAYKFDSKNQPVELRSGQPAIRSLTGSWERVYFLLDWYCS